LLFSAPLPPHAVTHSVRPPAAVPSYQAFVAKLFRQNFSGKPFPASFSGKA
jgi:hypothetical protein